MRDTGRGYEGDRYEDLPLPRGQSSASRVVRPWRVARKTCPPHPPRVSSGFFLRYCMCDIFWRLLGYIFTCRDPAEINYPRGRWVSRKSEYAHESSSFFSLPTSCSLSDASFFIYIIQDQGD